MTNEEAIKFLSQIKDALLANNSWLPSTDDPIKESFGMAINALTAQSDIPIVDTPTVVPTCEDTISRQDAIRIVDGIDTWQAGWRGDAIESMKALPSAQPDLVRCNECEYGAQDEVGRWFCRSLGCQIGNEDGSGFCADAERRTDG